MTEQEIITLSNATADRYGIPRELLLACAIAESNLDPNTRRPKDPARDAEYWPDVSFGLCQQTVRWAQEYIDSGGKRDYPGAAVVEDIGALYYDPQHALEVAAGQLRYHWILINYDVLRALYLYNRPDGAIIPAARANYQLALIRAQSLLAALQPQPTTGGKMQEGLITDSDVRFRIGPGTDHDALGRFYKGVTVPVVEQTGGWTRVAFDGYVSSQFVQLSTEYPVYGQRDPRWAGVKIGKSNETIGAVGCLITCLAMAEGITPDAANAVLTQAGLLGYTGCSACLNSFDVQKALPHLQLVAVNPTSGKWKAPVPQAELDKLTDHLKTVGGVALVEVDMYTQTSPQDQHFILAVDLDDDGKLVVNDPWTADQTTVPPRYGGTMGTAIWRYILYTVSPVKP